MKVKILQTCSSGGFRFEKDQEVEVPEGIHPLKPILLNLLALGFAEEVKPEPDQEQDHE